MLFGCGDNNNSKDVEVITINHDNSPSLRIEDAADLQKDHVIEEEIVIKDQDDYGSYQNHEDIDLGVQGEISREGNQER